MRPAAPAIRRPVTPNTPKSVSEINRRLEQANIRHNEFVREQKERVARDNEQRKRRVHQNLMIKQQEKEREMEVQRQRQEKLRLFEEAQRTPTAQLKPVAQKCAMTPSKFLTPRSKEVPQKRQKQEEPEVQRFVSLNKSLNKACF